MGYYYYNRSRAQQAAIWGGIAYSAKVLSYSPIAYWPLWEASGTTAVCQVNAAQNGTYARDVSTMTTGTGVGDGKTAPLFDGTQDYCDIYSAALNTAFSGTEGTAMAWGKVANAGVWTDGANRDIARVESGSNNRVFLRKNVANNQLNVTYRAGSVSDYILPTFSSTDFFQLAATWSASGDEVRIYIDGIQTGATQVGLGVWVGALHVARTTIGAQTTIPSNTWHGYIAHVALFTSALPAASILDLATV